jgi:myosin V
VLESFGNAKTLSNDNSSRFGKYLKLYYTDEKELVESTTESFLLEKTRLVSVPEKERNYHIFYQLIRGLATVDANACKSLELTAVEDFRILTRGGCSVIRSDRDDVLAFEATVRAMSEVGFRQDDLTHIWQILAAILHLGNAAISSDESSTLTISTSSMEFVARLLGMDADELSMALTSHIIATKNGASIKVKRLTAVETMHNVHGLMKLLYHQLFDWIIGTINDSQKNIDGKVHAAEKFIGILDICGFEITEKNSYEQLCINFVNESLQQYFNDCVFASEQELYLREGLQWKTIDYHDNGDIISLFTKKPTGLFSLLEEQGMMNRSEDSLLLSQYHQLHGENSAVYAKPRFNSESSFIVKHFAGLVTYFIDGFLSKNSDALQADVSTLLASSTNAFLRDILTAKYGRRAKPVESDAAFHQPASRSRQIASFQTVSASVRSQLDSLIATLQATESRYVKCIRPNDLKSSCDFESSLAMKQIRYSDIIGIVRIRGARFHEQMLFADFCRGYRALRLALDQAHRWDNCLSAADAKKICSLIISKYLVEDNFQLGRTMVFLRSAGYQRLEDEVRVVKHRAAVIIQKRIRGILARQDRRKYAKKIEKTVDLPNEFDMTATQSTILTVESMSSDASSSERVVEQLNEDHTSHLSIDTSNLRSLPVTPVSDDETTRRAAEAAAIRQRAFQTTPKPVLEPVPEKKTWREYLLGPKSRPKDKELKVEFESSRIRRQALPQSIEPEVFERVRQRASGTPSSLEASLPSSSFMESRSMVLKPEPVTNEDALSAEAREREEIRKQKLELFHPKKRPSVLGSPLGSPLGKRLAEKGT